MNHFVQCYLVRVISTFCTWSFCNQNQKKAFFLGAQKNQPEKSKKHFLVYFFLTYAEKKSKNQKKNL